MLSVCSRIDGRRTAAIFAVIATFASSFWNCSGEEDIAAPPGFVWRQLPFINGAVLKPESWFFNHRDVGKEKRYLFVISRENFEAGQDVRSVLNIVVIQDIPGKKGMTPTEFSADMIRNISKKTKITKTWSGKRGAYFEQGFLREDKALVGEGMIKEHYTTLSNNLTGTLYILSFVAPMESWERDWPVAEKMIGEIRLDDKY